MPLLDPDRRHPMVLPDGNVVRRVVHLKAAIDHPRIEVGAFSYFDDASESADPASALAPYLFALSPERLVIGKFCQIAHGVRIVTSSANHAMGGFSTYPFANFMMTPETTREELTAILASAPNAGDTVIGNDVWIGMDAVIMPRVRIGDGAIIAARAVVTRDVAPYTIIGGNPAEPIRARFAPEIVAALLEIAWWDWPIETIEANLAAITGADIDALRRAADDVASSRGAGR